MPKRSAISRHDGRSASVRAGFSYKHVGQSVSQSVHGPGTQRVRTEPKSAKSSRRSHCRQPLTGRVRLFPMLKASGTVRDLIDLELQSVELGWGGESGECDGVRHDDISALQALQVRPAQNFARKRFGNAARERFGNGTRARWGHLRAEAQCMLSLARSLRSPRGLNPWSAGGWPHRHRRTTARIRRLGALLAAVVGIVGIAAAGWILAGGDPSSAWPLTAHPLPPLSKSQQVAFPFIWIASHPART
jgi:hypothetical protein